MTGGDGLVRRADDVLRADPTRVVTRLFLPGQEILTNGMSRADAVIDRVLNMSEQAVDAELSVTRARFDDRHPQLSAIWAEHAGLLEHRLPRASAPSAARRQLLGAYFTLEFAAEAAAIFNPSVVAHPDQGGLAADEVRFIMSVRAVGEGHISSVGFRTGSFTASGQLTLDEPGPFLVTGETKAASLSREFVRSALSERGRSPLASHLLGMLPVEFTADDLDLALASTTRDELTRGPAATLTGRIRWIASCNYQLSFPADRHLSERLVFPHAPDESHGIEDARFTRFIEAGGDVSYYATYTAYDGSRVSPHLMETKDFQTFRVSQLVGGAAQNKGMAIFPRRVGGQFLALTRWDREANGIAHSSDGLHWSEGETIQTPQQPWELIQLGNCGPPVETDRGWLVLTHGVGPMRSYGIGALLLDIHNPTRVIGRLRDPLLTPASDEREGYVPNVVYSCGSLLHQGTLLLPYGCSDSTIRFAFIDIEGLLDRLVAAQR
jgi:predicted GH43/DUF377 family glycosyl hydrolase